MVIVKILIKLKQTKREDVFAYIYRADKNDASTQKVYDEGQAKEMIDNGEAFDVPFDNSYIDAIKKEEVASSEAAQAEAAVLVASPEDLTAAKELAKSLAKISEKAKLHMVTAISAADDAES